MTFPDKQQTEKCCCDCIGCHDAVFLFPLLQSDTVQRLNSQLIPIWLFNAMLSPAFLCRPSACRDTYVVLPVGEGDEEEQEDEENGEYDSEESGTEESGNEDDADEEDAMSESSQAQAD